MDGMRRPTATLTQLTSQINLESELTNGAAGMRRGMSITLRRLVTTIRFLTNRPLIAALLKERFFESLSGVNICGRIAVGTPGL
jgi:hypothetical protein